jgi:SOS-response transcriptional repressor LexA
MIKKSMTEDDHLVYNFIVNYITTNGYSPSYREITKGCHISSVSEIIRYLNKLQSMGKIKMKDNTPRAIRIVGYKFVKVE